jgi:hypothetical protein
MTREEDLIIDPPLTYKRRRKLIDTSWRRGQLSYKLHDYQQELYQCIWNAIYDPKCLKFVLIASRKWGKTFVNSLIGIEFALRYPGSQIRFAAPTGDELKKILSDIFRRIIKDAPTNCRPIWKVQDRMWIFPNGSEIHCAGTDGGNAERLRGPKSDLNLVDEAGFMSDLDYIYRSVLVPQTLTTGGTTIISSTPPRTPAHDLFQIFQEAVEAGFYKIFTIYDNKTLTKETIDLYAKESGGYNSTTFKREYLCQWVVDETLAICSEFKDEYIVPVIEHDKYYKFYHKYDAMDLGVVDFTAVIYGYYDFKQATLYIEDESTMNGPDMTTVLLKDEINAKEKEIFGEFHPYRRIADNNNLILLQDLGSLHQLYFTATSKDNLDAMCNELRLFVGSGKLKIHSRCKKLIGCLKYGIWDNNHKEFSRKSKAVYGHFDHLAALVYLVRNLDKNTNPIPSNFEIDPIKQLDLRRDRHEDKKIETIKQMFGNSFVDPEKMRGNK